MSLTAKLQFGDNGFGLYSAEYMVADFKCHISRRHNKARPDSHPKCESLEMSVVVPGREDLNLYEWFVNRSPMSGHILIELSTPAQSSGSEIKEVRFEDGVCFAISEEYSIGEKRRRIIRLSVAVAALTVDRVGF